MQTLFLCFECINNKTISSTEPLVVYGLTLSENLKLLHLYPVAKISQPRRLLMNLP